MDYILGVDGGGTKTTAVIAHTDGKILAEAIAGGCSYISVGVKKATENLNQAVFEAMDKIGEGKGLRFKSSCFGSAALNVDKDFKVFEKVVKNKALLKHLDPEKVLIFNDTRIGLEAGSTAKNKIIIIAGTGSNCFGINEASSQAGCNGWDYILADEGSGFEVSIRALRAVMRSYDGRGEKTLLAGAVMDELSLKDETGIVDWTYGEAFSKERLGRFARIVCDCACKGDKISQKILEDEACESILSVSTVVNKLKLKDNKFDLVFVGGLFKCEKYFRDIVMKELEKKFKKICFKPLVAKPVHGAVRLAINNL
jgi:N-acetylglucosamine kinase-like BadF-type ATPase